MFLITPKAKAISSPEAGSPQLPPRSSRPVAKIGRTRATKACDRCRVKKIKCDGVVPCLRCTHDDVVCLHQAKEPGNRAEASRQYISSLEMQQRSLVDTLQKMSRAIPQAINDDDLRQILETLKAHGCETEGVPDGTQSIGSGKDFTGDYREQPPQKRKRCSSSPVHDDNILPSGKEDRTWGEIATMGAIPPVERSDALLGALQTPLAAPVNTVLNQFTANPHLDPLCNQPIQATSSLSAPLYQPIPNPPPWPADQSIWNFDARLAPTINQAAATTADAADPQSDLDIGFSQAPAPVSADWSDIWWDPSLILTGDLNQPENLVQNGFPFQTVGN